MSKQIKRIGVLTSGGDAPGMNAAVRAVVRTGLTNNVEVIGIRRGWNGLISGDFQVMQTDNVSRIIHRGGTILYTARSEEFRTEEGQKKAVATCKMIGLDGIIAIGGDGTFNGALALSKHGIPVIGIPATIDNDIGCSHYTIGFDSACNAAIHCIDMLRDTMQSHERCSVVEVMGRRAGNLALYVGISTSATVVLIPERELDFQTDVVDKIRAARLGGSTHFMVVVAEGVGNSFEIANRIQEEIGITPCVTVLGHIQRGGSPTARDREVASRMGYTAVKTLLEGKENRIIATQDGQLIDIEINEALAMKKKFQMDRYDILEAITRSQ
ncbi:MAG: ATP-dependent 6-phosphofructokinase [Eubacteriales bacterium]